MGRASVVRQARLTTHVVPSTRPGRNGDHRHVPRSKYIEEVIGAIVVDDFNIHHNSAEGKLLHRYCIAAGLQQLVHESTRGEYQQDLVLADADGVKCKVLPSIADHSIVWADAVMQVPRCETHRRSMWQFAKTAWHDLKDQLASINWGDMENAGADAAADFQRNEIQAAAIEFIPKRV